MTKKSNTNLIDFLKQIQVYDCEFTKIRVGDGLDGGYVVLHEICEKTSAVYSFGIGEDISFEKDYKKRYPNTEMYLYDPFLDNLSEPCSTLNFYKKGLGNDFGNPLVEIVQDSLLKMDVEGCEWDAFNKFDLSELEKFSQIICEFHIIEIPPRHDLTVYMSKLYNDNYYQINENLFKTYSQTFKRLLSLFKIVHIHANNSLPLTCVNGHSFPPLLELTLLRKDLSSCFTLTQQEFPVSRLDLPNKLDHPDLHDYYPLI